jgi:hypothetical protein
MLELAGLCAQNLAGKGVWVSDIAKFNLAEGAPSARIKLLKPGSFPSDLRARLKLLIYNWTPKEVVEKLNIPAKFVISGIEYKYAYEYYQKFSTLELGQELKDDEILRPCSDSEHSVFIDIF